MKSAVVATGGKQYLVHEGDTLLVEKLPSPSGSSVTFNEVLLTASDKTIKIGTPHVKGATVTAEVARQFKTPKVFGVKMKAKKRYRRLFTHRQPLTSIRVTAITTSAAKSKR
jgi:large subunit ribosomal protein L21